MTTMNFSDPEKTLEEGKTYTFMAGEMHEVKHDDSKPYFFTDGNGTSHFVMEKHCGVYEAKSETIADRILALEEEMKQRELETNLRLKAIQSSLCVLNKRVREVLQLQEEKEADKRSMVKSVLHFRPKHLKRFS